MGATILTSGETAEGRSGWLIGPKSDVLWIVNVGWPVVAVGGWWLFQRFNLNMMWVYLFLAASHRWLTLPLVAMDWEQVRTRRGFVVATIAGTGLAFAAALLVGVDLTQIFALVVVVDFWHRSAQHFGMVRQYERADGGQHPWWHGANPRWLQALTLYVFVRAVAAGVGITGQTYLQILHGPWVPWLDAGAMILAGWIVFRTMVVPLQGAGPSMRPYYLASMATLYALMLGATMRGALGWATALYAAGSYCHAVEYFAIVSWRIARRRHTLTGWRQTVAGRWVPLLLTFIVAMGVVGWYMPPAWAYGWLLINMLMSLLHYQIDGIIWKRPKPVA